MHEAFSKGSKRIPRKSLGLINDNACNRVGPRLVIFASRKVDIYLRFCVRITVYDSRGALGE